MKVQVNTIRAGNVLEYKDKLWVTTKVEHINPGKGGAFVGIEAKDLRTGTRLQERFRSGETIDKVRIDAHECTFLFAEGDLYTFMDKETFEQISMNKELIGDQAKFLQDGMEVTVSLYETTPVEIELPKHVTLRIVEADPVVKGQTAASSYKPAILENGARVMVPPHIEKGTRVVVATADASYVERAKD
jgi:elongation factor P